MEGSDRSLMDISAKDAKICMQGSSIRIRMEFRKDRKKKQNAEHG